MIAALGPNPTEPTPHPRAPRSRPPNRRARKSPAARRLHRSYRLARRAATQRVRRPRSRRSRRRSCATPSPTCGYLRAYTLYKAGDYDQAIGDLEGLARGEPAFVLDHPELYFFLARAHDALQHFDKAVRSARVYVEAQMQALATDRDGEAEPSARDAPVSDAPGEAEKAWKHGGSRRMTGTPCASARALRRACHARLAKPP